MAKLDYTKICIIGGEIGEPYLTEVLTLDKVLSKKYNFKTALSEAENAEKIESFISASIENGGFGTIIFITYNHHKLAKETAGKYEGVKVIVVSSALENLKDKIELDEKLYYVHKDEKSHEEIAKIIGF